MLIDQLEARRLLTQVAILPFASIDHGVLRISGNFTADQLAVNVVNGVAKIVFKGGRLSTPVPQDYRQTLKSRRGHVFRTIDVDLIEGDDVASITSDIPVNIRGGAGNDQITLHAAQSRVSGGDGDDTIVSSVIQAAGGDVIHESKNFIEGNAGNDRISTAGGDDEIHGGTGTDTVVRLNRAVQVVHGTPSPIFFGTTRANRFSVEVIELDPSLEVPLQTFP